MRSAVLLCFRRMCGIIGYGSLRSSAYPVQAQQTTLEVPLLPNHGTVPSRLHICPFFAEEFGLLNDGVGCLPPLVR